jgi:prepilin-type N-terminal cleavage/methylation domain-containing protein/prepilin-type processing-associated H-X9-DG protein
MTMTTGRNRGFTLIELLVVTAIIGVLVGLLLPAVQAVREAARRLQCKNNLMQLGLAVQNYQNTHEVLPPGSVNGTRPIRNIANGYHVGWIVQILPFIEQKNVWRRFDDSQSVYALANQTVRSISINTLICPSDPSSWVRGTDGAALSSYAACHHDVEAPIDVNNKGVFFLNSAIGYDDIPDGTGYTIFIGEKRAEQPDLGWASGTRATLRNTGSAMNRVSGPVVPFDEDSGSIGPGGRLVDPVGGFSSFHPGLVNFLFGDGSVRAFSSGTTPEILRLLGNRADGEMIDGSHF